MKKINLGCLDQKILGTTGLHYTVGIFEKWIMPPRSVDLSQIIRVLERTRALQKPVQIKWDGNMEYVGKGGSLWHNDSDWTGRGRWFTGVHVVIFIRLMSDKNVEYLQPIVCYSKIKSNLSGGPRLKFIGQFRINAKYTCRYLAYFLRTHKFSFPIISTNYVGRWFSHRGCIL